MDSNRYQMGFDSMHTRSMLKAALKIQNVTTGSTVFIPLFDVLVVSHVANGLISV